MGHQMLYRSRYSSFSDTDPSEFPNWHQAQVPVHSLLMLDGA